MTHRSQFEVVLVGRSGDEYPWRIDFDAAFGIEVALGGVSPMHVIASLGSVTITLTGAAAILGAGMECYREHHKSDHREMSQAKIRRALQDIGLERLCKAIAKPMAEVYNLIDDDEEPSADGEAADPTTAATSGGS